MINTENAESSQRQRLLDPIDRISEILFGLIMAMTIIGSLSIATAGREDVRTVMVGALGCNVAWGLVDAIMYLIRIATDRNHNRVLGRRIRDAEPQTAREMIAAALPEHIAMLSGPQEVEAMRKRLLDLPPVKQAVLRGADCAAALAVFVLVVLATFPVVLPFVLTDKVALAMTASRAITVAMLFAAGFALGRYAGHRRPGVTGAAFGAFGMSLIALVMALGG